MSLKSDRLEVGLIIYIFFYYIYFFTNKLYRGNRNDLLCIHVNSLDQDQNCSELDPQYVLQGR